ncbi:MAG: glutamine-synthetase adenylyltransferase, partial [Polaromonas sp.]|nr:glutamine-synthetase adenylyltransferase [Polaromonas sp.]
MTSPVTTGTLGSPAEASPDLPSSYSRFVQRVRRRYAAELDRLPPGPPTRPNLQVSLEALRASGLATGQALRMLRQLVIERLVVLDCDSPLSAPGVPSALPQVMHAMTALAALALDIALEESAAQLDALHGAPLAPSGQRAQMWVVGMGKLGGRELNVSSDIDLIYIYDHDGDTAGRPQPLVPGQGRISNHEYFAAQVKLIYALIGESTEHGFVFRMDLALRPHGNSGPTAMSL